MTITGLGHAPSSSASPRADESSPARLLAFLHELLHRFDHWGPDAAGALRTGRAGPSVPPLSLELAEAALRLLALPERPPQIVVLGPTQTGKSTVVNLLLDQPLARVSPLAGFTVHAQAFDASHAPGVRSSSEAEAWSGALFPGWPRRGQDELSADDLQAWSLTPVEAAAQAGSRELAAVVWDTPDFDSLAARDYRRGVIEAAALADVVVFVLSKEKYSDMAAWSMLALLAPLGRETVICVNKLDADARDTVIGSLRQRLAQFAIAAERVRIVALPPAPSQPQPQRFSPDAVGELRAQVAQAIAAAGGNARLARRAAGVGRLLAAHWEEWTAPIRAEQAAHDDWRWLVASRLREALDAYRRDYLDHPQRYDSFRRATAELLNLLEVPGVGALLRNVRQVITWPARRLFAAGKQWLGPRGQSVVRGGGSEAVVLSELIERLLTGLERDAARRAGAGGPGAAVWAALSARLEQRSRALREELNAAAQASRDAFAPEIERTANRLYETLAKKPALLNSLRAARSTTDLASILVAIKTGGASVNDVLLAPAMFGLVSLLTEGALGSYMLRIADDLKRRQLDHVRAGLFDGAFAATLTDLGEDLSDPGLFGIAAEREQEARVALDDWRVASGA